MSFIRLSLLTVISGSAALFMGCTPAKSDAAPTAPTTDVSTQIWSCRNNDAEITCAETGCLITQGDDFTPMDLTLNETGDISLCAYSGCWEGQAKTTSEKRDYFAAIVVDLQWSGVDGPATDMAVTLNRKTKTATILTDSYAHPMTCKTL